MLKVQSLSLILVYILILRYILAYTEECRTFTNEINVRFNEHRFQNCEVHLSTGIDLCSLYLEEGWGGGGNGGLIMSSRTIILRLTSHETRLSRFSEKEVVKMSKTLR